MINSIIFKFLRFINIFGWLEHFKFYCKLSYNDWQKNYFPKLIDSETGLIRSVNPIFRKVDSTSSLDGQYLEISRRDNLIIMGVIAAISFLLGAKLATKPKPSLSYCSQRMNNRRWGRE